MEKKHENPPENFCSVSPIMQGIDSYSARSKYYFTVKRMCAFLTVPLSLKVQLPDYKDK